MKFEVGERVQFIYAGKLRTGGIKKFTQGKGEVYAHIEVDDTQACVRVTTDNIAKLDQPEQQSEKIKKINEIMLELIHRKDMDILNDDDITKMLIEALNIVNTLDEPKPVVVPKFVADWIEYCEKHRWGLSEALEDTYENSCMPEEVTDWLADCHENQELFARAWMGDYEVGEPLYYVRFFDGGLGFLNVYFNGVRLLSCHLGSEGYKTKFTESEIKNIDTRYWSFAVPVEEVEETK